MVKIRLQRVGSKHKAKYRVVVAEKTNKRGGKTLDTVGFYDTTTDPAVLDLKSEVLEKWIQNGAKPTIAVSHLIRRYERSGKLSG